MPRKNNFLKRLVDLEKTVKRMRSPQLAYSSVEDGALTVNVDGVPTMSVGYQFDGTSAPAVVSGPTPPVPETPSLSTEVRGGLTVFWDGTFADGDITPMDFANVTAHLLGNSVDPYFEFDPIGSDIGKAVFSNATGGSAFIPVPETGVEYQVVLVCWSLAGRPSAPSQSSYGIALDIGVAVEDEAWVALLEQASENAAAAAAAAADAATAQAAAVAAQLAADDAQSTADGGVSDAAAAQADATQAALDAAAAQFTADNIEIAYVEADEAVLTSAIVAAALAETNATAAAEVLAAAAETAAITHGETYADTVSSAAETAASAHADTVGSTVGAAAAVDATTKSLAAQAAAISTAAADATTKANQAYTDAAALAAAAQAAADAALMGSPNLATNSSFERATLPPWSASTGATAILSTADHRQGAQGVLLTRVGSSGEGIFGQFFPDLVVGERYTASVYLKRAAGSSGGEISAHTGASAVDTSQAYASDIDDWTRLSVNFEANSTAVFVGFSNASAPNGGYSPGPDGSALYADMFQLEFGSVATAWSPSPADAQAYADSLLVIAQSYADAAADAAEAAAVATAAGDATTKANAALAAAQDALDAAASDITDAYQDYTDGQFPIGSTKIQDDAITTPKLVAGAIVAEKIAAGAVTAEKLTIGSVGDNVLINGTMTDIDYNAVGYPPLGWSKNGTNAVSLGSLTFGAGLNAALLTTGSEVGGYAAIYQDGETGKIPVRSGQQFYVEATVAGGGVVYHWQPTLYLYDREGGFVAGAAAPGSPEFASDAGGHGIRNGAVITIPDNDAIYYARVALATFESFASLYFFNVAMNRVQTSALIADGAITTPKVVAGAIITEKLDALAVTAEKIAANAVTANKLNIIMGGGNLVSNSSFQNGLGAPMLTGWTSDGGGGVIDYHAYRGPCSYLANGGGTGEIREVWRDITGLKEGNKYTISVWVWPETVAPSLIVHDGDEYNLVQVFANMALSGWQRLVIPGWVATSSGIAQIHGYSGANAAAYFDCFQVEEGDVATAWAPMTDEILPGTIVAPMIQASAITTDALAAGAVVAAKIAAGSVVAEKIAAGAVTTEKLTVGALGENLVINPRFQDTVASGTAFSGYTALGWTTGEGAAANYGADLNSAYSGGKALAIRSNAGDYGHAWSAATFPVTSGMAYAVTALMGYTGRVPGAYIRIYWYNAAGSPFATEDVIASHALAASGGTAGGRQLVAGAAVAPSTAVNGRIGFYNYPQGTPDSILLVNDVTVRPVVISAQIADGAITTPKLVAGAVTASEIAAGAVTATKISATAIDGKTITGALVQSDAGSTDGVKFNTGGIIAYNASGDPTFSVDAATGAVTAIGPIVSGGEVTGATVTGGTVRTSDANVPRVIIDDAGLRIYGLDGPDIGTTTDLILNFNSATGALTLLGAIQSGSTITGAEIVGSTVTGGMVQTTEDADRGIKIFDDGLVSYDADGVPTLSIDAATGDVSMLGALLAGGTVTGAVVQTGTSGERIVIDDDKVYAYSGLDVSETPTTIDPGSNGSYGVGVIITTGKKAPANANEGTSRLEIMSGSLVDPSGFPKIRAESHLIEIVTTFGLNIAGDVSVSGGVVNATMGAGSVGTGTFRDSVRTAVGGRIKPGVFSGSTDASSTVVVTHGLGTTPTAVTATGTETGSVGSNRHMFTTSGFNSTTFTVTVRRVDGVSMVSTATAFSWIAAA